MSLSLIFLGRFLFVIQSVAAFAPIHHHRNINEKRSSIQLNAAKVGIFFGTSTGSTETVADLIAEGIGSDVADGPFDIETIDGSVKSNFDKYDALIVGTPTWNTGADIERSGTGWDELYYGPMQEFSLENKKVAVFGLGDQESYSENYADATGELHDVFEKLGCTMMGYTSQDGYDHEASKAIRGDLFCGLLCDMVNQEDLTEERVQNWVEQLKSEGFFEDSGVGGGATTTINGATTTAAEQPPIIIETTTVVAAAEVEELSDLDEHSTLLDKTIEVHATPNGFTPYYNPQKKSTMWVSADGRNCYYTSDTTTVTTTTTKSVSP